MNETHGESEMFDERKGASHAPLVGVNPRHATGQTSVRPAPLVSALSVQVFPADPPPAGDARPEVIGSAETSGVARECRIGGGQDRFTGTTTR